MIRAGDTGDLFYVIESGEVDIEGRRFGPGESFGEIALLRDVPRTATVTAASNAVFRAIDREEFLAAVTGHQPTHASAEDVVAARLGGFSGSTTTRSEGGQARGRRRKPGGAAAKRTPSGCSRAPDPRERTRGLRS